MENASTPTSRNIITLRRCAARLMSGKPLKDPRQLYAIADEMERVYKEMQRRHFMGHEGAWTGLHDRNGTRIYIGDTLVFDRKIWHSGNNVFRVRFEDGELTGLGTFSDWSDYCRVMEPHEQENIDTSGPDK